MADCTPIGSNVNAVSLAVALGCDADANTVWYYLQPNDISSFAAVLDRVARSPISLDRQRKKGSVTNLSAAPAFPMDTTVDAMAFWAPIMHFTVWKGVTSGAFGYDVSATTTSEYTVTANGALAAGTLVIARGFKQTANNGLKTVDTGSTATSIPVVETLVAETTTSGYSLHECGFAAATGDIVMDSLGNLTSTALDFTTLPLNVGQYIYLDGLTTSGYMRITSIAANVLMLDNHAETPVADAGTGKDARIFYGLWCRNVPVDNVDFTRNPMMIEVGYELDTGRVYEYADVAVLNTAALALPLTDKSTLDFATVAKDITPATDVRRLGTWVDFTANELFNTSDDIARLRLRDIDDNGLTTYFTECTVNVNNNVTAKNVLGMLGAADIMYGNIEIGETMTTLFTDTLVTNALRNNTTCSLELVLENNDGAVVIDQPEITLGNGEKSFPVSDKVEIALENEAFGSETWGYTQSVSLFRYIPA